MGSPSHLVCCVLLCCLRKGIHWGTSLPRDFATTLVTDGRECIADLQPADVTLEAVEAVLFQVCDGMKGMIKPGKTLVRETIR
jgi:hypothetical protein